MCSQLLALPLGVLQLTPFQTEEPDGTEHIRRSVCGPMTTTQISIQVTVGRGLRCPQKGPSEVSPRGDPETSEGSD